jgi:acetyl-CoA C-acetyltransferase
VRFGQRFICGTEAIATSRHLQRTGQTVNWDEEPVGHTDDRGAVMDLLFDTELNRHGAFAPVDIYPLQEQARRGELGLDKSAYREQLGGLMARFAEVAARNPYAMFEAPDYARSHSRRIAKKSDDQRSAPKINGGQRRG